MKLVLLPGMDGTGRLFAPLLSRLDESLEPVVIAYPEHEQLDYGQLHQFVRARLPEGEPFVLLGESFSGPVALTLAAAAPAGLCGLILCATFMRNPMPVLGAAWPDCGVLAVESVAGMGSRGAALRARIHPAHAQDAGRDARCRRAPSHAPADACRVRL